MPNKQCIKCSSTEKLSIKYRTKIGREPRYICTKCRMDYWNAHKPEYRQSYTDLNDELWQQMFKESYDRLSKRAIVRK
jgi:transposase-like protein